METTPSPEHLARLAEAASAGVDIHDGGIARLRQPTEGDVELFVRACRDPLTQALTEVPLPYETHHAEEFITRVAPAGLIDGRLVAFVITDARDSLLGLVSLHDLDQTAVAAVGYWVAPWARGRHVASTALRGLAQWCFDVVGLRHLVWQSLVGNVASLRVAANAGFIPEGTARGQLRHRGEFVDCWLASLGPTDMRAPDPLRTGTGVEIAAGVWQLQPISTLTEGVAAEYALPVSACVPTGVWAVKHSVTAQPAAYVALLTEGGRGWVVAAPAADAPDSSAAESGRDAVLRYARGALGLQLL